MNEIGKLVCGVSVYFGENILYFFWLLRPKSNSSVWNLDSQSGFININILATNFRVKQNGFGSFSSLNRGKSEKFSSFSAHNWMLLRGDLWSETETFQGYFTSSRIIFIKKHVEISTSTIKLSRLFVASGWLMMTQILAFQDSAKCYCLNSNLFIFFLKFPNFLGVLPGKKCYKLANSMF